MTTVEVVVEILIDGAWLDITGDVYDREQPSPAIRISRGRADESGRVDPSECSLQVHNLHGRYSPRNPTGPLYGKIGRNTPIRVSVPQPSPGPEFDWATFAGGTSDMAFTHTPFAAPKGVLVLIVHSAASPEVLAVTYGGIPMTEVPGTPVIHTSGSEDGLLYGYFLGADIPTGRQEVAVDVNATGSSKAAVCVTLASAATTTVLDDTATLDSAGAANPSVMMATTDETFILAALHSGHDDNSSLAPDAGYEELIGVDFGAQVASWIRRSGVPAGSPTAGWTATTEEAGILAVAVKSGPNSARFYGEVSSWPPRWTAEEADAWVPITAAGIMRRLGQGASPLLSVPRRYIPTTNPVAYWPFDDGPLSRAVRNAVAGGAPFRLSNLPVTVKTQLGGGEQLAPWLGTGLSVAQAAGTGDSFAGPVNVASNVWSVDWVFRADLQQGQVVLQVTGNGFQAPGLETQQQIYRLWFFPSSGQAELQLVTPGVGQVVLGTSGSTTGLQDGQVHHVRLSVHDTGNSWIVYVDGEVFFSGNNEVGLFNQGIGSVGFDYTHNDAGPAIFGHVAVWDTDAGEPAAADVADAVFGHPGETAGRRILRLCVEEGIPLSIAIGDFDDTQPCGPQYVGTLLELAAAAQDVDMGILDQPREFLGLAYRTGRSLYNQTPALALNYADGSLAAVPQPTEDDFATRNDITVTRRDGSSARAVQETGPLNLNDPRDDPRGVGRYTDSVTLDAAGDGFLSNQASWRRHLGTVDEARWPRIKLRLQPRNSGAPPGLPEVAAALDVGDRVTIDGLPDWLPPDQVSLVAVGFVETIGTFGWDIEANCVPESPYQVAVYGDGPGGPDRYDTAGSSLASGFDAGTDTSMSVAVDVGPLWTVDAAEFPLEIEAGGVRLEVTDITGGSSPQTFTVTPTPVNGVIKTIPAGTPVSLWKKATYAL